VHGARCDRDGGDKSEFCLVLSSREIGGRRVKGTSLEDSSHRRNPGSSCCISANIENFLS